MRKASRPFVAALNLFGAATVNLLGRGLHGELAYPVEEITIAGNLKQMFADIEVVGSGLEFRGRIASPTIKIREMMIAGN